MKPCIKCNQEKPLGEFYTHPMMADGHLNKCKTCCKADIKANIAKRKLEPEWMAKERKRCREKQALRRANGNLDKPSKAVHRKWYLQNKHKVSAERKARHAMKKGHIRRPKFCQQCGNPNPQMHHPDYSKPLLVEWLCTTCHGKTRWK